ncbi:MAG: rRNA maturation RNase YbeY [Phycisphaeraceae bacterium]|nr:rRNA maturation RNase YbeY [Phycisphaeraceae bacterium]
MSQPTSSDIASQAEEPDGESDKPPANAPSHDDARTQTLSISLSLQAPATNPPITGWLDVQLRRLAEFAQVKTMELSIAIVDDQQMSDLHQKFMNISGTTDVLTFDLSDDPTDFEVIEGELVLCTDEASRQAASRGHQTRDELLLYALHGLLHLMGYDDHNDEDYKIMHQREDELLTKAGFDALFAREEKPL